LLTILKPKNGNAKNLLSIERHGSTAVAVRYKKSLLAFFLMAGSRVSNGWKGGLQ
jgi:hypothetical protein